MIKFAGCFSDMSTFTWILLAVMSLVFIIGIYWPKKNEEKPLVKGKNQKTDDLVEKADNLNVASYNIIVPLRIQACERLLLFLERIQFPVLVKRVYQPGISRGDFQFLLIQNVSDEFEHNLAQRLYVTEKTWRLVSLAKEDVLNGINALFSGNQDADVARVAAILGSSRDDVVEEAIISIKREFDCFLI